MIQSARSRSSRASEMPSVRRTARPVTAAPGRPGSASSLNALKRRRKRRRPKTLDEVERGGGRVRVGGGLAVAAEPRDRVRAGEPAQRRQRALDPQLRGLVDAAVHRDVEGDALDEPRRRPARGRPGQRRVRELVRHDALPALRAERAERRPHDHEPLRDDLADTLSAAVLADLGVRERGQRLDAADLLGQRARRLGATGHDDEVAVAQPRATSTSPMRA